MPSLDLRLRAVQVRERLIEAVLGPEIERRVAEHLAAVSVRVDDSPGWTAHEGAGPTDRPWHERQLDIEDAFEAWQKNFLVRRIVTLARSYVIGSGITLTSQKPTINRFVDKWWNHPQNRIDRRLAPMLNELIRAGELFPTLHTNTRDGMSFVRFVPASCVREIKTADNDYEVELEYGEQQKHATELKWWIGPGHKRAYNRGRRVNLEPLMLHYAINREIGCTRGEGDLTPLLPWAKRYTAWLQDRVRLNRIRTRQGVLDVKVAEDTMVEEKRSLLTRTNPLESGIYVHGPGEEIQMQALGIQANQAADDGRALRLACVTAANVGLHYVGEGETVNYATAKEMGEPTARYYAERQQDFTRILLDLAAAAYHRYCAAGHAKWPKDGNCQLQANTTEVARADNESLARSANLIARALRDLAAEGWIDDETAATLAFKFAGEPLGADEIARILDNASMQRAKAERERDSR